MKKAIILLATFISVGVTMAMPLEASVQMWNRNSRQFSIEIAQRHHSQYVVYYRRSEHGRWHQEGTYRDRHDAERAARRLSRQGYEVRIEQTR